MVKRKKPGRVKMPPERFRGRIIGVKVNPDEYRRLAEAAGPYPVATWARAVLLGATEDPTPANYRAPKKAAKKGTR